MLEFFKTDIGKVALGGLIALGGQLAVPLIAWMKEAWFAASKDRKEAEYLAIRLVLVFDELTNDCYNVVHDPLMQDQDGCSQSTVGDPTVSLPEGEYKALPRSLMYEVMSMPNRLDGIKEGMASAWEFSGGPPDYDEFFEYRREHWSRLGLRALTLIDELCGAYKIPQPERPEYYAPKQSFEDELREIAETKKRRDEHNQQMNESISLHFAQLGKVPTIENEASMPPEPLSPTSKA
jgi:hypothetical protein